MEIDKTGRIGDTRGMSPLKKAPVHRFAHEAMATVFEVFIAGKAEAYARQAARAAFDEVDRLERLFSRFDPSSETSRIGRLRPGESLRIGIETAEVLGLAAAVQAETGGAFDVNYLAAGRAAAEKRPMASPPALATLIRVIQTGRGIEVVRIPAKGRARAQVLDLDLGAVGKGYALDSALAVLQDWEVGNVLLHAGTSTALAAGPGPGKSGSGHGWPIGAGSVAGISAGPDHVFLRDRALSGSGTEVKGGHIVDPRTGRPARGHQAAWASHPSAAAADALSTAFMVMTASGVSALCGRHPEAWALVINARKKCRIFNAGAIAENRPARTRRQR
ncbi:MAG: FAD:protein FMN transferase [Candidatus Aminicenantes bacterium]|nr:MAG: FAD:protein FMN transferase [Candidatus Aminicenantes bacterium]